MSCNQKNYPTYTTKKGQTKRETPGNFHMASVDLEEVPCSPEVMAMFKDDAPAVASNNKLSRGPSGNGTR